MVHCFRGILYTGTMIHSFRWVWCTGAPRWCWGRTRWMTIWLLTTTRTASTTGRWHRHCWFRESTPHGTIVGRTSHPTACQTTRDVLQSIRAAAIKTPRHMAASCKGKQGISDEFDSCDGPIDLNSNWIQMVNYSACVTLNLDGRPWKTIGHFFYTTSGFVHHLKSIDELKLESQSGKAQFGSKLVIFLSHVTFKFDKSHWKTIRHLFYTNQRATTAFIRSRSCKLEEH